MTIWDVYGLLPVERNGQILLLTGAREQRWIEPMQREDVAFILLEHSDWVKPVRIEVFHWNAGPDTLLVAETKLELIRF